MEYEIVQYPDDIEVFYKGKEFLKVVRKLNWRGTLRSQFYRNDVLILECNVSGWFFKKSIVIKYQSLNNPITLSKVKGDYFLIVDSCQLMTKVTWMRNPVCMLYRNGNEYAEVYKKYRGFSFSSYGYKVVFQKEAGSNIYGLIWILMNFHRIG